MLNWLASHRYAFAIAVLLILCLVAARDYEDARHKYEQKCEQAKAGTVTPPSHQEDCERRAESAANDSLGMLRVFKWSEITTWAILLTLLAIAEQTRETARSAETGEIAAQAALKQAEHIAASDRAWVLMLREKTQKPYLVPLERPLPSGLRMSHCIMWIKNFGNSPAQIVMLKAELQIGDKRDAPPHPEIYEANTLEFDDSPVVMPQQEEWPMEGTLTPDGVIRQQQLKNILEEKTKFLWLCGIVRYRDIFGNMGKVHESRICLIYETFMDAPEPSWRFGPPKYNTAT